MSFTKTAALAGVALLVALLLAAVTASPGSTPPILDAQGNVVATSVAEVAMLELGGVEQFVLIRGRDRSNPVLLFLHGGPGDAQTPLSRHYNASLEDDFVVVNWDQRGAGRSFDPELDPVALSEAQLVSDARELGSLLRERFGGRRLIVAGHSWGSYLGIRLVDQYPDDFAAYVGIGQVANQARSEALSYAAVLAEAQRRDLDAAVHELEAVGPPDAGGRYRGGLSGLGVERRWVREFGGAAHGKRNLGALMTFGWPILTCREYRLGDKLRYLDAEATSMHALEGELLAGNLMAEVPRLEVPVFILQGRHDLQTVTSLTRAYFDELDAPHKEFVLFEDAAHLVPFEQPERFHREMVDRVRPWAMR